MRKIRLIILPALGCLLFLSLGPRLNAAPSPHPANSLVAQDFEAGRYLKAAETLKAEVQKKPDDAQANLWLARCFIEMGKYDQAINYAEQSVKLSPDSSEPHLWLGQAYGLKAEQDKSFLLARKSRHEFQQAVNLGPNDLKARRSLMQFYLEAPWILGGSKDKAWKQVEEIASRDAVAGHLARALYWQETGKADRAAAEYRQVIQLKPKRAEPYFEAAEFEESNGNAQNLEMVIRAASLVEPDDPRLSYYSGVAEVIEGRSFPEAEQHLKTYINRSPKRTDYPSHAAAHDWLGKLYEHWGRIKEAVEQYRAALQLSPENQTAHKQLQRLDAN